MNSRHGMSISVQEYARLLGFEKLTPLERIWVCPKCGFTREFKETKQNHIAWHERRIDQFSKPLVKSVE